MGAPESRGLQSIFRRIVAWRWRILAFYALLFPAGLLLASRVESDHSVARLIVRSDADYRNNEAFQKRFPEGEHVVLLAEAPDPYDPAVLRRVAEIEARLAKIPRVEPFSALTLFGSAHPGSPPVEQDAEGFRRFATGTDLLRKQGLVGRDFLGISLELHVGDVAERDKTLAAVDRAVGADASPHGPLTALRKIGEPYVNAYLEAETTGASRTYFPLFGLFIIVVNLSLYRSWRTLVAFLVTLAVCVTLTMAAARLVGFVSTIVSSLVPLTILITCTAALVYIQSRFAENPEGNDPAEHQIFALANKFLATTASIFAAATGFAALAVSRIRPIREMGLWVAMGLLLTWVVVFTLFPALQKTLRTPTLRRRTTAGRVLLRLIDSLPRFSYRWRWMIVPLSLLLMLAGVLALTGLRGSLPPMRLETDTLDYIDHNLPVYQDTRRFERAIGGLSVMQVWITTPQGDVLKPEFLRGMEAFAQALERDARVGSVTGPTTLLRWARYLSGGGDRLPEAPEEWESLAAQMEGLLLSQTAVRGFIDTSSLSDARLTVIYRGGDFAGVEDLKRMVASLWSEVVATHPALSSCRMRVVGQGLLQAKIAEYLVPTLTESFLLTALIIFLAFLLVFRSPAARLLAMIPSVFAILVMFLVMRLTGIPLNVATILIASTVLGASENDQIHLFYHFQEKRASGSIEEALRHTLRIAGRAIVFATFINASGFLALALSGLPPMRQFGIISASAFVLSMIASFTALPAALWIFFRERPDSHLENPPVAAGGG
ncbi:MAG TPA: MMPL family transporter [Candidatus Polarisedimenticolia bacterium]|nr:MMPL family transporter [Candidatus Polarisedimenticolia bacterium]